MKWLPLLLLLVACEVPTDVIPVDKTVPPIPGDMGDVKSAKWIRLPGAIVSRGAMGAFYDPDEALCTEPESIYLFYDDFSIVQYKPLEGYYANLAQRGRLTVEIHNRDNPDALWDLIAVGPPPPPPPITSNDPVLDPLVVAFVDDTGTIQWSYTAEDNTDYDRVLTVLQMTLEIHNRDNDPDCHIVLGGRA